MHFLLPILILVYCFLLILVLPKLDFLKITPIMAEGIKPVLEGAIPNMNFPFAQILPVIFFYKNSKVYPDDKRKYLVCTFSAIVLSAVLLTFKSFASIMAFDEASTFSVPIAILIGVAMPFLIPRFDIILGITVPYFFISLPLFFLIPLLLFITIKMKDGRKKYKSMQ